MTSEFELSDDTPVYVISVAAQLSGLHPQTLRAYDRLGLVSPGRTAGGGRRYSLRDILILREVQRLSAGGGREPVRDQADPGAGDRGAGAACAAMAELRAEISQLRAELESTRAVAARLAGLLRGRSGGALVPVRDVSPSGRRPVIPPPVRDAAAASDGLT